jgi:dTMP kinase
MSRGFFITFEGVDGCGKSTQAVKLFERLRAAGRDVILTREPGGTSVGVEIRRLLLDARAQEPLAARAEALLFAADRAQHVAALIRPTLERGGIVLCDRFADSTRAYQGFGRQADPKIIESLISLATDGLNPDLTLLFDLPVSEAQKRLARRCNDVADESPSRLDAESEAFHERVRNGFLTIAARESDRFHILDARSSIESLHEDVLQSVQNLLLPTDH